MTTVAALHKGCADGVAKLPGDLRDDLESAAPTIDADKVAEGESPGAHAADRQPVSMTAMGPSRVTAALSSSNDVVADRKPSNTGTVENWDKDNMNNRSGGYPGQRTSGSVHSSPIIFEVDVRRDGKHAGLIRQMFDAAEARDVNDRVIGAFRPLPDAISAVLLASKVSTPQSADEPETFAAGGRE